MKDVKKIQSAFQRDLDAISVYIPDDLKSDFARLVHSYLDPETGKEINNPTPMVIHADLDRPLSTAERIEWILNRRLSRWAQDQGLETEDDAQDFGIEDDESELMEQSIYQVVDADVKLMKPEKELKPTPPADVKEPPEPPGPTKTPGAEGADPQN